MPVGAIGKQRKGLDMSNPSNKTAKKPSKKK